jgi:WD40 repeat protein
MAFRRFRFSLAHLMLLIALVAIAARATVLLVQPNGTPEYFVSALAFSPDGGKLAASLFVYRRVPESHRLLGADASQSFFLFNLPGLDEGKLLERSDRLGIISIACWRVRQMGIGQSLAFSPDRLTLATKGLANRVSLWNVADGQKTRDLKAADDLTGSVSWAENDVLAASGTKYCYLFRTNSDSAENFGAPGKVNQYGAPLNYVVAVLSRDGTKLATTDIESKIELWDVSQRRQLFCLQTGEYPFDKPVLAFSPDGRHVAVGAGAVADQSRQTAVRVCDTETGEEQLSWDTPSPASAIAFSPDGKWLAASGSEGTLSFLSLTGGKNEVVATGEWIAALAFSPDGTRFATGDFSGQVLLWDMETKKVLRRVSLYHDNTFLGWPILFAFGLIWVILWRQVRHGQNQSRANDPK